MTWWTFIFFYLWQNSLRRWWEQPLSLLSKLVVAALLGLLGACVILGVKNLGDQLDQRLKDRNALTVVISEIVPAASAPALLMPGEMDDTPWRRLAGEVDSFLQTGASAEMENGRQISVWAVSDLERYGLVDDIYYFTDEPPEGKLVGFEIKEYGSEAVTKIPSENFRIVMNNREGLVGGVERLSALLAGGFTKTLILRANSVEDIGKAHEIVNILSRVEGRRVLIQSNLEILRELEKVKSIQAQSLLWVTAGSSMVLGLVFGSLAWMEFREERYLLSLIRTFGVGRLTLLGHALIENCLLAVGGVTLGFGFLVLAVPRLNLSALKMTWLGSTSALYGAEGQMLLMGAALGGVLSCIPIAIGLRKPLGLVLK